jgi:hypothetical protein
MHGLCISVFVKDYREVCNECYYILDTQAFSHYGHFVYSIAVLAGRRMYFGPTPFDADIVAK